MGRDWTHVPDWNKPYNLREVEENLPDELENDQGFQQIFAVGMFAYEKQR